MPFILAHFKPNVNYFFRIKKDFLHKKFIFLSKNADRKTFAFRIRYVFQERNAVSPSFVVRKYFIFLHLLLFLKSEASRCRSVRGRRSFLQFLWLSLYIIVSICKEGGFIQQYLTFCTAERTVFRQAKDIGEIPIYFFIAL